MARRSRMSTAIGFSTLRQESPSLRPGTAIPKVAAAIAEQAQRLIHMSGTDFYYAPEIELAERLARLAPGSAPKRVFFTNSGAESIEAALKLVAVSHAAAAGDRLSRSVSRPHLRGDVA